MTLQEMAQALKAQATSSGVVTLDDTLLGSGTAFAQAVTADLLRPEGNVILTATAGAIPDNPTGTQFSFAAGVPATAARSFLALSNNAVTVTISLEGITFQVELSIALTVEHISAKPRPWVFSTSFPILFGWPFDGMPFTGQTFQFVFAPVRTLEGLSAGLNFSADIALTGLLNAVQSFLATFNVQPSLKPLSGTIVQTPSGPSFDLRASLGVATLNLRVLQVGSPYVGISMDYIREQGSTGEFEPNGLLYIGAQTSLVNSESADVNLTTIFSLPLMDELPLLNMAILPVSKTDTTLANLGQWMGGQNWNDFFSGPPADRLLPFLNSFGLRSYSMNFDLGAFSVASTTLCVGTLSEWPVVPGSRNLIVKDFGVTWTVFQPFINPQSMLAIRCSMDMFGDGEVIFKGSILLPDLQLTLGLASGPKKTGAQWLQKVVTAFGGDELPTYLVNALSGFTLDQMLFSMDAPAQSGRYTLVGGFLVGGTTVDFNFFLDVALTPTFTYGVKIAFFLGSIRMAGEVGLVDQATIASASWSNETNPLELNYIAESLGYESLGIPKKLDMALTAVGVAYDLTNTIFLAKADSANYGKSDILVFKPKNEASYLFFGGLDVGKPIDLTNLPLVGKALSLLERVEIRNLKVQLSSAAISSDAAKEVSSLLAKHASGYPAIPAEGMASTVNISMEMAIGGFVVPLGTGVGGKSNTTMPASASSVLGKPSGNTTAPVTTTPGGDSDGTTWFNVQKAVGPVMFRRVGVRYKESVLWFALDASFEAGGLTIDLIGMAIGSPLSDFNPTFTLDGLGISFEKPGFELAGSLMKIPPVPGVDWQYAGGAVLRLSGFMLSAVGSYASTSGVPSMFIFAQATGSLGGPPAFFVTGLAAGFGYNSSLRLPAMDQIYQFPLIAGAKDPAKIGGKSPTPAAVLGILMGHSGGTPWITQQVGQYWFAAGIQFSSFELVSTNALLVVEFGERILLALLGLSRASFPKPGTAPASVRYAFIELQISTIVDPEQGVFSLTAILSPNSFLLDPSCKLTGGFAFYTWFSPSKFAGDFVITVGGYHPSFDPPPWYPQVPAVGFSWSLDSTVSISGKAYFALTPSAIMAGGQLSVTYQSGNLRAWFRAWANMLIYWNPFHFDVEMGVTIGAAYRMDLGFTAFMIEVELGATLKLWGPQTGGEVTVHWWIISFTIAFGADRTPNLPALTWPQFQAQLPPANDIVKILPVSGLAPNGQTDMKSSAPWAARPAAFTFNTLSSIPNHQLLLGSAGTVFKSGEKINIRPMGKVELLSTQTLVLKRGHTEIDLLASGWQVTEVTQNVAKALWGTGPQGQMDPGDAQLVDNQLSGFLVSSPSHVPTSTPGPVNEKYLAYTVLKPVGTLPIGPGRPPHGPIAQAAANTIELIELEIADQTHTEARDKLFRHLVGLGINPLTNGNMTTYGLKAGTLFTDEPLLVPE